MSILRLNSYSKDFDVEKSMLGAAAGASGLNVPSTSPIEDDEISVVELGAIGILGSSRASLRFRSASNLNASRRSIYTRSTREDIATSRLLREEPSLNLNGLTPDEAAAKKEEVLHELERSITRWDVVKENLVQFKGYALGILSAFLLTLSHVIMRQAKFLSGSDHALIRYLISLVFLFVYIKYHNLAMFPKDKLVTLLLRGFMGSIGLISSYFAVMFTNPSDVVTIIHTSIVITALLSRIFFKEKLTLAHLVAVILSFVGVILISKPAFLFPVVKMLPVTTNYSDTNSTVSVKASTGGKTIHTYLGLGLSFFASTSISCVFCLIKKLNNSKVHWAVTSIYVCWFGIPFASIICIILMKMELSHKNLAAEKNQLPMDVFYSSLSSWISLLGQILLNIALNYEEATKVAIVKTIDVFFSAVLQYLLLNITMDYLNMLGAGSILAGTSFILVFKILESQYEGYKISKEERDKNITLVVNTTNGTNDQVPFMEAASVKKTEESKWSSAKSLILKIIFVKI